MSIVQKYSKRSYHCFPYSHGYMNKLFIYNLSSFLLLFEKSLNHSLLMTLKGVCHGIFDHYFFTILTHLGS